MIPLAWAEEVAGIALDVVLLYSKSLFQKSVTFGLGFSKLWVIP